MKPSVYDYVIVGSGIAGLYMALLAKEKGSVLIITKGSIEDCNTRHAQGGIAAAIGKNDNPDLHYKDTMAAGAGLNDPEAVRVLVEEGPQRIADLIDFGVPFDTADGQIALTKEAAHSVSRILHAGGDATGEHVEVTLSRRVRYSSSINVLEYCLATEVIVEKGKVKGVKTLDLRAGSVQEFECRWLVLATGGAGKLFKYTTNSEVATADGIVLAYKAGAEVTDMEFFQFHPTALRLPGVAPFLISEAVRGEGGVLRNVEGYRFMSDYTPKADLAPRDVVARSIVYEMRKTGSDRVFLDVTHLPAHVITTRFPHIYKFCMDHGLDITKGLISVAPAAHYIMGGIRTNVWGETSIKGLFAAGETACTGVHGANRLASNSLLETIVFGHRIVQRTQEKDNLNYKARREDDIRKSLATGKQTSKCTPLSLLALQSLMWEKVGIVRSGESLAEAGKMLAAWDAALPPTTDRPSYELNNLVLAAKLMTEAALAREESRGAHFRTDYPRTSSSWKRHIVFQKDATTPS
ncbi:MAG: L-aspartate oxidase [Chloroflexi bacterium]|nr:L-aspartate oxidase [Chloroflexota bacterium]